VETGTFNSAVDVDPITNLIFVTDNNGDDVAVVDGRNNTVQATVPLSAPSPNGVAVNPVRRIAYVTEFDSTQVQLISER
jgi:YVTN family beta-propeller protein